MESPKPLVNLNQMQMSPLPGDAQQSGCEVSVRPCCLVRVAERPFSQPRPADAVHWLLASHRRSPRAPEGGPGALADVRDTGSLAQSHRLTQPPGRARCPSLLGATLPFLQGGWGAPSAVFPPASCLQLPLLQGPGVPEPVRRQASLCPRQDPLCPELTPRDSGAGPASAPRNPIELPPVRKVTSWYLQGPTCSGTPRISLLPPLLLDAPSLDGNRVVGGEPSSPWPCRCRTTASTLRLVGWETAQARPFSVTRVSWAWPSLPLLLREWPVQSAARWWWLTGQARAPQETRPDQAPHPSSCSRRVCVGHSRMGATGAPAHGP